MKYHLELSSLPDLCSLSEEDGGGDLFLSFPAGCEAACSGSSNMVPECGGRQPEGRVTTNVIYFILRRVVNWLSKPFSIATN